jgi:tripartite-type tricarboxylate transporter receptor subunit TctC
MPRFHRRTALTAAALLAAPALARAQAWPARPLRIIVPFTAGGATDLSARLLAERLTQALGQSVIVENRPGAGGNVGAELVAKAEPDGHTLLMCTIGTASINQFLYDRLPFDPQRDFASIGLATAVTNAIIVHPQVAAASLRELLELARRQPGRLNYATPGNGTSGHLCGELLKVRTSVDITHVPYRGTGALMPDLLGGRVEIAVDNLPAYIPHIREGRLRILAVTSAQRWFAVPDAPTVIEAGIADFEALAWFGVQAPARTPRPVVERLAESMQTILRDPATVARVREFGAEPRPLGPAEFDRFIAAENEKWREVVRVSGARLD